MVYVLLGRADSKGRHVGFRYSVRVMMEVVSLMLNELNQFVAIGCSPFRIHGGLGQALRQLSLPDLQRLASRRHNRHRRCIWLVPNLNPTGIDRFFSKHQETPSFLCRFLSILARAATYSPISALEQSLLYPTPRKLHIQAVRIVWAGDHFPTDHRGLRPAQFQRHSVQRLALHLIISAGKCGNI